MKKIKIEKINEYIYYEKLECGLEVYLYSNPNYHSNYGTITTKFGGQNLEFVPYGEKKMKKYPSGIAHFMEHKLFLQENGPQPDEFFTSSGTDSNACTTSENTTYEFMGPNNVNVNVSFLLDYVFSPYFTDESIENEKGIIEQEINMTNDKPFTILYYTQMESLFKENPIKERVIGNVNDIRSLTKEMFYECYNTFYHPSNMFLVLTGNFDPQEVMNIIKDDMSKKEFPKFEGIKLKEYNEPNEVVKEEVIKEMNVDIPKIAYNIKIPLNNYKNISKRKLDNYITLLFIYLFDDTSDFDEEVKKERILYSSIRINTLLSGNHLIVSLIGETEKYDILFKKIEEKLSNISISDSDLERKKKAIYSNNIFIYDSEIMVNESIIGSLLFDNTIENNIFSTINDMNKKEMDEIIKKLDVSNVSRVIAKKK